MKGDTRCVDGRLWRHDPQDDDPYLETDIGQCPECEGKGCAVSKPVLYTADDLCWTEDEKITFRREWPDGMKPTRGNLIRMARMGFDMAKTARIMLDHSDLSKPTFKVNSLNDLFDIIKDGCLTASMQAQKTSAVTDPWVIRSQWKTAASVVIATLIFEVLEAK